jgi:cytochrome c-type biogenesis protein CcmF
VAARVVLLVGALAAAAATIAALVPLGTRSLRAARLLLLAAATALVVALVHLGVALVTGDYALVYVADHTRRGANAWYRLAGLWGGMEGSLLLWSALLAVFAALAAWRVARPERGDARATVAVLAGLVAAFAGATALTANPFRTLQVPATDGGGLVPILEHPAMLVHPPLLYAGLVSTAVVFAATVGALLAGTLDDRWRRSARTWLLVPWILLALGMVAGANWAYVELGWGGYWAWDPIENTALLPWLAATAALHQLLAEPPGRSRTRTPTAALALLAWVLAALGTLLTRSGSAVSVHAFAESDPVAVALACIWVAVVVLAVVVSIVGARRDRSTPASHPPRDASSTRSTLLRAQTALVLVAIVLIAAGTVTPVVRSALGGADGVTTGDFFATWTAPLVWAALVLMAVAPALRREPRLRRAEVEPLLRIPVLIGLALATLLALQGWTDVRTLVTATLAGTAAAASVMRLFGARRGGPGRIGSHLAHLGFAILLVGLAGATAGSDRTVMVATGDEVTVGGVSVRNDGVRTDPGVDGNPRVIATFAVDRGGRQRVLEPEIVGYPAMGVRLAESALWSDPTGDVQLAMRTADDDGRALVDIHVRPLTPLVWWGALVLALGGVVAAATRRGPTAPNPAGPTPSDRRDLAPDADAS